MSERKIAVFSVEFYVDGKEDFEDKSDRLFEAVEGIADCPDCSDWATDHECGDDCQHRCNMVGMSGRLLTEEQFDREFLGNE